MYVQLCSAHTILVQETDLPGLSFAKTRRLDPQLELIQLDCSVPESGLHINQGDAVSIMQKSRSVMVSRDTLMRLVRSRG